jgi:ABC-type Fe3+-hydroxamate transport system substrate-binding protein
MTGCGKTCRSNERGARRCITRLGATKGIDGRPASNTGVPSKLACWGGFMSAAVPARVRSRLSLRCASLADLGIVFLLLIAAAMPLRADRKVMDELGRAVVVPDHPNRIVCLIPSVVDDVYSLGAGQDVVAISDFTKYPAAAKSKRSIGLPMSPSLEAIVALHPDLVLGSGGFNGVESIQQLTSYGIPVFMVDPHGLQGLYTSLLSLGRALNRENSADALVLRLKEREAEVRARAAQHSPIRVFMPVWYDPIVTIGKGSFISELVEAAGARSITDDISQEWPQVSLEAVIARNPDALLLVRSGKFSLRDLQQHPGWNTLAAVRAGRIFYLDDRVEYPSPVAFDALEDFAKQLYP